MHGEATCASHPVVSRCALCARPGPGMGASGWSGWGIGSRCPRCSAGAIETQHDARARIPVVRAAMADIGIALTRRVRVTLADPAKLSRTPNAPPGVLGLTHQLGGPSGFATVAIEIASGLTPTHFGATLAHEIGHAWLAERTADVISPLLEEGVCEVFAGAWLKRRPDPLAASLRDAMAANPDPVYGAGYRAVRAAVAAKGIRAVLHSVTRSGSLP
ncbi:protein DA1 [Actinokineospora guangxiensis]|uniref:Protein DA1 n=1 Tax=Actinokineospora guangxiensis TaxID=1490288 RepID=A0ABW0EI29_9PSEU